MPQTHLTRFALDVEPPVRHNGEDANDPPSPASSTHTDSSRNRVRPWHSHGWPPHTRTHGLSHVADGAGAGADQRIH
jgi:hypothetical protein